MFRNTYQKQHFRKPRTLCTGKLANTMSTALPIFAPHMSHCGRGGKSSSSEERPAAAAPRKMRQSEAMRPASSAAPRSRKYPMRALTKNRIST